MKRTHSHIHQQWKCMLTIKVDSMKEHERHFLARTHPSDDSMKKHAKNRLKCRLNWKQRRWCFFSLTFAIFARERVYVEQGNDCFKCFDRQKKNGGYFCYRLHTGKWPNENERKKKKNTLSICSKLISQLTRFSFKLDFIYKCIWIRNKCVYCHRGLARIFAALTECNPIRLLTIVII